MRHSLFSLALLVIFVSTSLAGDPTRVLPEGQLPSDSRLGPPKTHNDYFPWIPPAKLSAWEARKKDLREQLLVANGLWPMPEKTPLKPIIHGLIDRGDYTIEKVFFASYPGHYVTGNLYRPKGRSGKLPGVLCPHGHWNNGRFYEASDADVARDLKSGAEKTPQGAKYPLQARCAQLARMGCVVFHYDMVGYADSRQIPHRSGFLDAEAELRLQSFMGLQTYNSIRSLDFLLGLPEVDPKRIGVTGASGGGTQTFILCAIDDRPAVAFPAVMVSTSMQGGCICENCSYLRQDTGNIELAALFAPKPLAMSAANDWTIDIETRGLPELRALYQLYGAEDRVQAKCWPEFGHNYNQVAREFMYNWFNKHLGLGQPELVTERPFEPVPPKELSVFDDAHPLPPDAVDAKELRRYLTMTSDKQIAAFIPKTAAELPEYRRVIGTALRVMINDRLPVGGPMNLQADVQQNKDAALPPPIISQLVRVIDLSDGIRINHLLLSRIGEGEQVPAVVVQPQGYDGTAVIWAHPAGKASLFRDGQLVPAAQQILQKRAAIFAADLFLTGEFCGAGVKPVDDKYAGFTFGYNRPLLSNRVHDLLTLTAYARHQQQTQKVHLLGFEGAGPWVLLARGLCGDVVARTAADFNQFRFENVRTINDEMMLPGALKYGGLPALAALAAPGELFVHNYQGTGFEAWVPKVYQAAGAQDKLRLSVGKVKDQEAVTWLLH